MPAAWKAMEVKQMRKHLGSGSCWPTLFFGIGLIFCAHTLMGSPGRSLMAQAKQEENKELANILSVVKVRPDPKIPIEPEPGKTGSLVVVSRDKNYTAYVLCIPLGTQDPQSCAYRAYFSDRIGTVYEIRGEPEMEETARPIDGLKLVNNHTLSYERWEGPHFGHRYVIDVQLKKQVTAYDLSDAR
jgi:hypothetical protein